MKIHYKHRYILTGTPGSGKTTLIQALAKMGHHVVHEAATDVIKFEQELGNQNPWMSSDFIEKIILLQKERQINANHFPSSKEFYDRSPICSYALALYLGFEVKNLKHLNQEIERIKTENIYEKQVFFIENLGFIENTDARRITFDEALRFEDIHRSTYEKFGYKCVVVPKTNSEKRIDFIKSILDKRN